MTIPINLAIRAVRLHIAMCDAGAAWPMGRMNGMGRDEVAFINAARAGYKATLEYLLYRLGKCYSPDVKLSAESQWVDVNELYTAVRPLMEHLDQTRPGWRTE